MKRKTGVILCVALVGVGSVLAILAIFIASMLVGEKNANYETAAPAKSSAPVTAEPQPPREMPMANQNAGTTGTFRGANFGTRLSVNVAGNANNNVAVGGTANNRKPPKKRKP